MESEETVITAKLDALQLELAEKELKQHEAEERQSRTSANQLRERGSRATGRTSPRESQEEVQEEQRTIRQTEARHRRLTQIDTLKIQVALLEELKAQVEAQRTETHVQFVAMKDTTERSSQQGFWLTIGSSAVSLVLGWLLSLLSTPLAVLHAFGR